MSLRKRGFVPDFVLDVGASNGCWSNQASLIFPKARYILVDPLFARYETAMEENYLKDHPELKAKLDERRNADSSFAKSADAQLNFVYQNSPCFEPDYLRYPVYRVIRFKAW